MNGLTAPFGGPLYPKGFHDLLKTSPKKNG
jgi:hypothetical protein